MPSSVNYGPVDLADINNARTLGVMLVPLGSNVLDIGTARGAVAETLHERHCRVWGVEVDHEAASAAAQWCEEVRTADVEALDLATLFPGVHFDVVLFLDVLEHLRSPASVLRKAVAALGPGGRVIASIPNVAHASVRLQLLAGRFVRTETGLLDRTHLQFFDRPAIQQLFDQAGLDVLEEFTVVRRIDESDIVLDLSLFSSEVLAAATSDPESEVYQFVIIAGRAKDRKQRRDYSLTESLLCRLRNLEREYCRLERWAGDLQGQVLQEQASSEAARDEGQRSAAALAAQGSAIAEERVAHEQLVETLRQQLADRSAAVALLDGRLNSHADLAAEERRAHEQLTASLQRELEQRSTTSEEERAAHQHAVKLLRQDADVRETYLAHLRDQLKQAQEAAAGLLSAQVETSEHARAEIQALRLENAAVHEAAARTLALPRYRLADWSNQRLRLLGPIHRYIKRVAIALLLSRE